MKTLKIASAVLASLLITGGGALADDYPSRPITMIVPFPAGGPSDVVARIIAEGMSRHIGQTVAIENVGGAGGTIGTARVAQATPDGYTILGAAMGSHIAAPVFYPNLKYDSTKDFAPIGMAADAPAAIVARKDFPAKDLREFVEYVRANGGQVKQAHGGLGASSHLACLMFTSQLGLKPQLVAYRGTGPAVNDVVGGHIDFFCDQIVSVAGNVKGGSIRAYAVSQREPSAALPEVPGAPNSGAPDYILNIWNAVFAPQGTPKPVVEKLTAALEKTLEDPATAKRLADLGGTIPDVKNRGPERLDAILKADIVRWAPILKQASAGNETRQ